MNQGDIAVYVVIGIGALIGLIAGIYYFNRWMFSMKRQLWNQKQQIRLLIMIAEKLGVPADNMSIIKEKNEDSNDSRL
jgi:hypothetical protein